MVSVRDAKNKALFVRNFVTISKTAGDNLPAAKLRTHSHRIFTKRSHAPRPSPTHLRASHAPAPLRNFARVRPSPSAAEGEHGGASTEARNAEGTKRSHAPRVPIHATSRAAPAPFLCRIVSRETICGEKRREGTGGRSQEAGREAEKGRWGQGQGQGQEQEQGKRKSGASMP